MIGSLRGLVLERTPAGEALVEVGGVGYRVAAPTPCLSRLVPGEPVFLFTHLHVREDAMVLYGFITRDERDVFETLIGATGVGPKLALAILSVHSPTGLRRAVIEGDVAALCLVSGVGKRTAQRLLLELTARFEASAPEEVTGQGGSGTRSDLRAALEALGYGPEEVHEALSGLGDSDGPVEVLLRQALRHLGAGRAPERRSGIARDVLAEGSSHA
ncbi:MAG: Holliday junction branch migration protein RuvA [Acidimicrobiia bacterium]